MNKYFANKTFDSVETAIFTEVNSIQKDLKEFKIKVEVKAQMGRMTESNLSFYRSEIGNIKKQLDKLNSVPFMDFYKQYDYFKFDKALQDVNLQ